MSEISAFLKRAVRRADEIENVERPERNSSYIQQLNPRRKVRYVSTIVKLGLILPFIGL